MEKKIRVGLIGCGGIANGKHMPSLKKVAECEMVAFCDIIVSRAEEAAPLTLPTENSQPQ